MTATPHNGKEEDFQLFLALWMATVSRASSGCVHQVEVSDLMRRMVKEKLLKLMVGHFSRTHCLHRSIQTFGCRSSTLQRSHRLRPPGIQPCGGSPKRINAPGQSASHSPSSSVVLLRRQKPFPILAPSARALEKRIRRGGIDATWGGHASPDCQWPAVG